MKPEIIKSSRAFIVSLVFFNKTKALKLSLCNLWKLNGMSVDKINLLFKCAVHPYLLNFFY